MQMRSHLSPEADGGGGQALEIEDAGDDRERRS